MALLSFEIAQGRVLVIAPNLEIRRGQSDRCLVIKENMAKHNYCRECAALILQKAKEELDGLAREVGAAGTSTP